MEQGAQLGVDSLQRHLFALVFARLQVMRGTCTMLEAAQKIKLRRRMQHEWLRKEHRACTEPLQSLIETYDQVVVSRLVLLKETSRSYKTFFLHEFIFSILYNFEVTINEEFILYKN